MPYQSNVNCDPQRGWSVNQTDMIIKTDAVGMIKRKVVVIDADVCLVVKLANNSGRVRALTPE